MDALDALHGKATTVTPVTDPEYRQKTVERDVSKDRLVVAYPALRDEIERLREIEKAARRLPLRFLLDFARNGEEIDALWELGETLADERQTSVVARADEDQVEIKRLRLELAAAKQQIRACHAAAHASGGIAEEAIGNHLRLLEQAREWTKEALK